MNHTAELTGPGIEMVSKTFIALATILQEINIFSGVTKIHKRRISRHIV